MHLMKRVVILAAKLLAAAVVLVAVALTILLVVGIPRPGSFTTEHVDWISNNTPFLFRPQRDSVVFQTLSGSGARLYEVDIETGLRQRLEPVADTPDEPAFSVATFSYGPPDPGSAASESTRGFLYLPTPAPPEGGRFPVIIDFHGGPDFMVGPFMTGVSSVFLDQGFAVVAPNYRGSTGFGVSFERSDDGLQRPRQLADPKLLVDWIRARPELDADRIVLFGASWGGTILEFLDQL